ncbi:MAG: hypothetical protein QUS13_02525 [Smithella sp.]|nr:hypothetical protein [Smithella sp.]
MEKINYKKEYEELIRLWNKAYKAYTNTEKEKRQDKRAREALRILGFTTGKRPIDTPRQTLLTEYKTLVAELPKEKRILKEERKKIIDNMAKKYGSTYEGIHKKLRQAIQEHRQAIQEVFKTRPYELEKSLKLFSNILPPHKQAIRDK